MNVTLRTWLWIRNNGDGTASAVAFPSQMLAEHCAEHHQKKFGIERFAEDVYYETFEIDNDQVIPPDYIYDEV